MSAWMCSNEHLSALAWCYASKEADARAAFACLAAANVDSLKARYPNDWEELTGPLEKIQFMPQFMRRPSPVEILKSVECYRYQACEHSEWEGSAADRLSRDIIFGVIGQLPGYEKAAWGAPGNE